MTLRTIDEIGVRKRLRIACNRAGGSEKFAELHRLPVDYVEQVLHNEFSPGSKLLASLGLMQVSRYARRPKGRGKQ